MKIVTQDNDLSLNLNIQDDFKLDLGREDNLKEFESETLRDIINPIENYETSRFIHQPYSGMSSNPNDLQSDIWFEFYFYRPYVLNGQTLYTHTGGLDYELVGISKSENMKMLKQATQSFFRLEFYKVPSGQKPEKTNRRLVFARDLSLPLSERVLGRIDDGYQSIEDWDYLFVPVFVGSNYRNKENMYIFWFMDDSSFEAEPILTGNTFYMSARFFNADDGSIINFSNKDKAITDNISENDDMYFQVEIDRTDYSYQVFRYDGVKGVRIGKSGSPIRFYEIAGGV